MANCVAEGEAGALEILNASDGFGNGRKSLPNFSQTCYGFTRASEKINVPNGWDESLDKGCLGHAGEWKLDNNLLRRRRIIDLALK